jgi:acetyl-CoA carboxylase biotin carboxyl carrier protein
MSEQILAPVSGNVWKVLVEEGATVNEDDETFILESMKMEIPVEAPRSGVITKLLVAENTAVAEGDPLAEIE